MKNALRNERDVSAVIVGASLSGLMTGIALAQEGIHITIIDKVGEIRHGGSGLRVNGETFGKSKTKRLLKQLVSRGKSSVQLWSTIESRLRTQAKKESRINLLYDTRVLSVGQDEDTAWVVTESGEEICGDQLIGVDGHNNRVRKHVAPHKPNAVYAGYIGWIASMSEDYLPDNLRIRHYDEGPAVEMFDHDDCFKFGSIIEREEGSEVGSRRIGCTRYDNKRSELLRHLDCVEGMVVRHSLNGQDIPTSTLAELAHQAPIGQNHGVLQPFMPLKHAHS